MGVVTRKDSRYYQLNLERGKGQRCARRGTTIPHSTGNKEQDDENRRLADVEYHHAMAQLARGRLDLPVDVGPSKVPTLLHYLDTKYREWLKAERPRSAPEAIDRLDRLFVPMMGHLPLDQITPAVVEQWRKWRRAQKKVSAHTMSRELSDLRGLLTNAVELGDLQRSPLADLTLPASPSNQIIRYLDRREEQRLYAALAARDVEGAAARARFNAWLEGRSRPVVPPQGRFKDALTPMVILSLNTGVRPTELFLLRWTTLDWQARTLTVEWHTSKGRKTRRLPLNKEALTTMKTWQKERQGKLTDYIFPARGKSPYTESPSSWDTVIEAANVENFRWYDLRHTFASKLVQRGISLYVVKDLMGHASIKTTERYAHLAPSQGRQAVNILNKRSTTAHTRQASV